VSMAQKQATSTRKLRIMMVLVALGRAVTDGRVRGMKAVGESELALFRRVHSKYRMGMK